MINCVAVFDGRAARVVYNDNTRVSSDLAWNLARTRSWCWKIHFETTKQSQKWQDLFFVHFSVRPSC